MKVYPAYIVDRQLIIIPEYDSTLKFDQKKRIMKGSGEGRSLIPISFLFLSGVPDNYFYQSPQYTHNREFLSTAHSKGRMAISRPKIHSLT